MAIISFFLFSVVLGLAREMCVFFDIRQRWQILILLLYDGARLWMELILQLPDVA